MELSPFARLPRELRDEIYKFASIPNNTFELDGTDSFKPCKNCSMRKYINVMQICRQMRNESLEVFWVRNKFHVKIVRHKCRQIGWVSSIVNSLDVEKIRKIRYVELYGDGFQTVDMRSIYLSMSGFERYREGTFICSPTYLVEETIKFVKLLHPKAACYVHLTLRNSSSSGGYVKLPLHDKEQAQEALRERVRRNRFPATCGIANPPFQCLDEHAIVAIIAYLKTKGLFMDTYVI